MSMITIQASDLISNSRADINTNFATLQSNKIETSVIDTDSALAANSDTKLPSQKAVKAYVDALGGLTNLVPTGTVLPYAGSSAPTYFLFADGSLRSRSTYAPLFGVIGTTYGVGDGSTTFKLPDLRNRIPMGAGAATVVATFASRSSNVITVTGLTNAANNEFQTGQAIVYHTTSGVITGLTNDTTYYLIRTGNLTFSLAATLADAQNGIVISLSSNGTGTQTFTLTLTTRTLGDMGGEENHAMSSTEILSHAHTQNYFQRNGSGGTPNGLEIGGAGAASAATHQFIDTMTSVGGNAAMNALQPFFVLNYIIKI